MADMEKENKKNFEENCEEKIPYNRKSVDRIKRAILCMGAVLIALPIYIGLYTMVKLNDLNDRVNDMEEKVVIELNTSLMNPTGDQLKDKLSENSLLLDSGVNGDIVKTEAAEKTYLGSSMENANVKNGKTVYLTFDDGPSEHTAELLDVLKEYDVKATFFVVCNPDKSTWPMYKRIVDEGHTLAMHSYSHKYEEIYASEEAFIEDVNKIRDFLYEQTGVECDFYRFPGGSSNSMTKSYVKNLIEYLDGQGITYFDWNSLSEDAVNLSLSPEELNANIMGYVRANAGNSTVLMHDIDACENTLTALPALIETLRREGYTLRPIDKNTVPVQHISYNKE